MKGYLFSLYYNVLLVSGHDNTLLFFGPTVGILLPVLVKSKLAAKDAVDKILAAVDVFD